jgi:hypothetical protein
VLTNDRSYWQPSSRSDTIDAAFRLHEGRILAGTFAWAARAGRGTTRRRDAPMHLTGHYPCRWQDYSQVGQTKSQAASFRYLLITARAANAGPAPNRPTPLNHRGALPLFRLCSLLILPIGPAEDLLSSALGLNLCQPLCHLALNLCLGQPLRSFTLGLFSAAAPAVVVVPPLSLGFDYFFNCFFNCRTWVGRA